MTRRPTKSELEAKPVRISKLLAERGTCSRREADDLIARGLVRIDGDRVAVLGDKVMPSQEITLDPSARAEVAQRVTILLHKPLGYVSGQAEDGYEPAVALIGPNTRYAKDRSGLTFVPKHRVGLAPAGRLDIDSTGLLVLTQSGTIARQLIGDNTKIDKEYVVRFKGALKSRELALLNHGLELDGRKLRPAVVTRIGEGRLRFVLREGRKRQIRRMCALVDLEVVSLKRIRIGRVTLGNLPYGEWRYLDPGETF